jgi:hypothetical protein
VCLRTSASFIGFMVNSLSRRDASTPRPPPTSVGGGGALVVPLSSEGAEGGQSSPDVVPTAPRPVDGEQHGGNGGQFAEKDWMGGHGSNGEGCQEKAEAAKEPVDNDF